MLAGNVLCILRMILTLPAAHRFKTAPNASCEILTNLNLFQQSVIGFIIRPPSSDSFSLSTLLEIILRIYSIEFVWL